MVNEQFKDFLQLIKNPLQLDTKKIMRKCCQLCYAESIDMSCMKCECIINTAGGKLTDENDNIKINISIDNSKSNIENFEWHKSINIDILLPFQNILNIIPADTRNMCNLEELDFYSSITKLNGYRYIDNNEYHHNGTFQYETGMAILITDLALDAYSDHSIAWTVISSKNNHAFYLKWNDYNDYISFYSHIINVMSNNLGDLLDKYNLLGE